MVGVRCGGGDCEQTSKARANEQHANYQRRGDTPYCLCRSMGSHSVFVGACRIYSLRWHNYRGASLVTDKDQLADVDRTSFGRALANAIRWTEETNEPTAVIVDADGYDYVTISDGVGQEYAVAMMIPADGIR